MTFWWMFDNHTFRELGSDVAEALLAAELLFYVDPHGSLFVRDSEDPSNNLHVHGHGRNKREEFLQDLAKLKTALAERLIFQI